MITFPLYLRERDSGTFTRFPDLESLEWHVEPIDVENDEYQAWDAEGRRLRLLVEQPLWLKVEVAEGEQLEDLMAALSMYAAGLGVNLSNVPKQAGCLYDAIDAERQRQYASKSWWGKLWSRF